MKRILEINKRRKTKANVKMKNIQKLDKLSQQVETPVKVYTRIMRTPGTADLGL